MLPVIVGSLPGGPPYFRSTASQVASQRLPWLVAIWMRHHGLHGAASCSVLLRMPIKRRHWQKRADEDDTHRRAVEPLKQNTHRSTTRASTSSFCLARWPHPSAKNVCLLTAPPSQSSQPTRQQTAACRPQFKRPSLYPPAPSTCSAVRFIRAVPIALPLGCLGCLAAGRWPTPRAERTELAWLQIKLGRSSCIRRSCLVSLRDAHNCHRRPRDSTIPSCQSCVKAKLVARLHRREKRQKRPWRLRGGAG